MDFPRISRRRVLAGIGSVPLAAGASAAGHDRHGRRGRPEPPHHPYEPDERPERPPGRRRSTVLRGADLVLTMDPEVGAGELGSLEGGVDVLMRDGAIAAVGRGLAAPPGARVVDVAGKLVLPGFVDVHNHLWQSSIRGGCSTMDVNHWLAACSQATLPKIDARDMYHFVHLAALDALQAGVTTVVDWVHPVPYDTTERYVRALDDAGLRFVYAMAQSSADRGLLTLAKKELIDPLPLASFQVAAHAEMSTVDHLRLLNETARDLGVMLNSHVLEHRDDRKDDPVRALRTVGAFGPGLLMNHAVHLTDDEIALAGARGVRVAHCPLSNMRLASGIAPLPALHRRGVRTGLGHDGGTNDTSDMFGLMKAAVGLQRARHEDPAVHPTIPAVLRMATLGGAECIGMADRVGSLTPGKRADVLVVDPGALNFAPRFDWTSQIVLNGQPSNVSYVFVDGWLRKARGELVHVDTGRVVREAERAAAHVRAAA
ncbi:5-methylthioadenosine deaminase [Streptomyces piniterrae]|uniref:5-methylthioadenosine deaminase n=1 Tax=Streptomyces piniterrae TaxID=2571125 RepID=A0A4U0MXE9_9ACTN|nr:amidohydrolase family protein [Streptomyces piniterrae]TJZ45302.1 5-methylthioadenosine deaminase [Streptomyces piniterrae]